MKLEICVFSVSDAFIAWHAGADRIELCASYLEGGITPSHATITNVFKKIDPLHIVVMIRPRGGNFMYDDDEFEVMKQDIEHCKRIGVKNIIFGISNSDGTLDVKRNKELITLAQPMHCTLQRAFDLTPNAFDAMQSAIDCGFRRILTSGQKSSAPEGKELIKELIATAGNKIDILPGAGILPSNAEQLIRETGCREIHASAKMKVDQSAQFRKGIYDLSGIITVNPQEVSALKQITLQLSSTRL